MSGWSKQSLIYYSIVFSMLCYCHFVLILPFFFALFSESKAPFWHKLLDNFARLCKCQFAVSHYWQQQHQHDTDWGNVHIWYFITRCSVKEKENASCLLFWKKKKNRPGLFIDFNVMIYQCDGEVVKTPAVCFDWSAILWYHTAC